MNVVRSRERAVELLLRRWAAGLAVFAGALLVVAAWVEPSFSLTGKLVATATVIGLAAVVLGVWST